jgi:hypothetical protein
MPLLWVTACLSAVTHRRGIFLMSAFFGSV